MVIMTMSTLSGKHRRCDARCYNGKTTTKCRCVCGGANHARALIAHWKMPAARLVRQYAPTAGNGWPDR